MEVINAGIGGHSTRDCLARLERDCLDKKPTLVVLKCGTNDTLNSRNLVPPEETENNLRALTQRITASGARLLLCTMLTYNEEYLLRRHGGLQVYGDLPPAVRFGRALAVIRTLAREREIPLVDLNVLFTALGEPSPCDGNNGLLRNEANCGVPDGVHPTPAGYRVIAAAIWQAIAAYRLPAERVVCLGDSITMGQYVEGAGTTGGDTYPAVLEKLLQAGAACAGER